MNDITEFEEVGEAPTEVSRNRRTRAPRASRTQESRAADTFHEETMDVDWEPKGLLDTSHVPPRPGYTQRWVRTQLNGVDDPNNVGKRLNQGWRPRPADTVPQGSYVPTIDYKGSNVVGMVGNILMERPVELHEKHRRYVQSMTDAQAQSVSENLYRVHERGDGFGRPVVQQNTSVSRGRQPSIADD